MKHTRFSLTIPSLAAKNAKTWEIKWRSSSFKASQWVKSLERSTSSAVQKEASAFLYICQISWYWMGKITNRRGLSSSNGSTFFGLGVISFLIGYIKKKFKISFFAIQAPLHNYILLTSCPNTKIYLYKQLSKPIKKTCIMLNLKQTSTVPHYALFSL